MHMSRLNSSFINRTVIKQAHDHIEINMHEALYAYTFLNSAHMKFNLTANQSVGVEISNYQFNAPRLEDI